MQYSLAPLWRRTTPAQEASTAAGLLLALRVCLEQCTSSTCLNSICSCSSNGSCGQPSATLAAYTASFVLQVEPQPHGCTGVGDGWPKLVCLIHRAYHPPPPSVRSRRRLKAHFPKRKERNTEGPGRVSVRQPRLRSTSPPWQSRNRSRSPPPVPVIDLPPSSSSPPQRFEQRKAPESSSPHGQRPNADEYWVGRAGPSKRGVGVERGGPKRRMKEPGGSAGSFILLHRWAGEPERWKSRSWNQRSGECKAVQRDYYKVGR